MYTIIVLSLLSGYVDEAVAPGSIVHWNGRTEPFGGMATLEATATSLLKQDWPTDVRSDLHRCRSDARRAMGNISGAVSDLEAATLLTPNQRDLLWRVFRIGLTIPEYQEKSFKNALRLKKELPRFAPATFIVGEYYQQEGRHIEAVLEFEAATQLAPTFTPAWVACAESNWELKRFARCLENTTQALYAPPLPLKQQSELYNIRGRALRQLGQAEKAEACFQLARGLKLANPQDQDAATVAEAMNDLQNSPSEAVRLATLLLRADVLHDQKKPELALRDIKEASSISPDNREVGWRLARASMVVTGTRQQGMQMAEELAEEYGFAPGAYVNAQRLTLLNREGEAYKELVRATEIDPDFTRAWIPRMGIDLQHQRVEAVIEGSNGALTALPLSLTSESRVHVGRGLAFLVLEDTSQAEANLLFSLRLDPSHDLTLQSLWQCYANQWKFDASASVSAVAVKLRADGDQFQRMHGLSLAWTGKGAASLASCQRAVEKDKCATNLCALGQCYASNGDFIRALDLYNMAMSEEQNEQFDAKPAAAFLMATCPVAEFRNGAAARQLMAGNISETTPPWDRRMLLFVRALAEAECGDFDAAMKTLEGALDEGKPTPYEIRAAAELTGLFRQGHAYRHDPRAPEGHRFEFTMAGYGWQN